MQRKEINIFSTSFLDLLSGALGAVLILFIIIPKMSSEQQSAMEEIEKLNVEVNQLEELIEQARNSIPVDLYEQIQAQMEALQNTITELTEHVQQLQQQIQNVETENRQLQEELEQTQRQLEQAQRQLNEQQESNQNISDGKVMGMRAELGIVCMWSENVDIDLHVKNMETGEECYHGKKATSFGNLAEDIRSRTSSDDDRYELFFQSIIVPGSYLIYVNLYEGETGGTVDGYVVLFPGKSNQKKINHRQIHLTNQGQSINIGILTVTNNNIILEQ
jgi:gas vesicle protein